MITKLPTELSVLIQLLQRDWYIFKQTYWHRVKMCLYWLLLTVFTTKMFLPAMGLQNFGPFILISSVISSGFFTTMQNAIGLIEDIRGIIATHERSVVSTALQTMRIRACTGFQLQYSMRMERS